MGTVRMQKFGKLIQKELSDIFLRDKQGLLQQTMVSIAEVKMTPDLAMARVYVTMMLAKDKEAMIETLTRHKGEIRKALGNRIRKQVRIVPDLQFYLDEVEERARRLDDLFDSLDIPEA